MPYNYPCVAVVKGDTIYYLYRIQHDPGQQFINRPHVPRKAVQYPSARICIEKSHGHLKQAVKHLVVQVSRRRHGHLVERKRTHCCQRNRGGYDRGVDVDGVVRGNDICAIRTAVQG